MPDADAVLLNVYDWEAAVRLLIAQEHDGPDPEAERREIRTQLRRLRENYEMGQYDGEEFVYHQKVGTLQQKLGLLQRTPNAAISNAADTLLGLSETWEWATREEQFQLIQMMFSSIAGDVVAKKIRWVRPNPSFDVLFRVVGNISRDEQGRYWLNPTNNAPPMVGNN